MGILVFRVNRGKVGKRPVNPGVPEIFGTRGYRAQNALELIADALGTKLPEEVSDAFAMFANKSGYPHEKYFYRNFEKNPVMENLSEAELERQFRRVKGTGSAERGDFYISMENPFIWHINDKYSEEERFRIYVRVE